MLRQLLQIVPIVSICSLAASAQPHPAPTKVVGAMGTWWIIDDTGVLRTFDGHRTSTELTQRMGGRVVDATRTPSGGLVALVRDGTEEPAGLIERHVNGTWFRAATLKRAQGEMMVGVVASDSDALVVSSQAVFHVSRGRMTRRRSIRGTHLSAVAQLSFARTTLGDLYIGQNSGEFGGGLMRVNVATGASGAIERRDTPGLCAGPLSSECDPVTAVIPNPTDGRCVIASVGLRHMLEHGRIVRVCGMTVTVVAELPCLGRSLHGEPPCSLGVFGLAADSGGFCASAGRACFTSRSETGQRARRPAAATYRCAVVQSCDTRTDLSFHGG